MIRSVLWMLVVTMVVVNAAFDVGGGPVVSRLVGKIEGQNRWPDTTFFPPRHPLHVVLERLNERLPLIPLAHQVLAARYALTFLPLVLLLYFLWAKRQITEIDLASAVTVGAFALAAKAVMSEIVWLMADVHTVF